MRLRVGWQIAVLAGLALWPAAALELPETGIAYEIEVTLDPATRMLDGSETIRWRNPAGHEIRRVPLHLYLNAFAHEDTTWMRGVPGRRVRADEFLERWPDPWGWSEPDAIRQNGVELAWEPIAPDDGNPVDRSLIEVTLAEPVPPGGELTLAIELKARLPNIMARTGGHEDFFHVAHWFPKIAVFETAGTRGAPQDRWAAHQFHGPTEFYADYADFDVRIGVPAGWQVVATGSGGPLTDLKDAERTWYRFRQRAVHDFAFSAGSRMVVLTSSYQPAGPGGPVEIRVFLPAGTEHQAERWRHITEVCLDQLGARVGPYPYETLTVVQPPARALRSIGMEYPTLFTGGFGDPVWDLGLFSRVRLSEVTIAHECAHQYFYGLVGTNEFEEAFLDEGFTQHWGNEIVIAAYGDDAGGSLLGRGIGMVDLERASLPGADADLPPIWFGPSYLVRGVSIGTQFYSRPATTLRTAAALYGRQRLDEVFALYYRRWAFRHPGFEDFLAAARDAGGDELAAFLLEAFTRPRLPDYRVAALRTEVWSPPRGRLVGVAGVVQTVTGDEDTDPPFAGLDPAAREVDGELVVEVLDPGWTRGDRRHPGRIERRRLVPRTGEPDADWRAGDGEAEDEFHLSTARLEGPGWSRLPVDVRFRFADGAVIDERWDGRAPYRIYRFLRRAPLSEVRIDPDGLIAVDPDPVNNARLRQPDRRLIIDWAAWLGALSQLLGEALAQWL